jgi:hypothetical protein
MNTEGLKQPERLVENNSLTTADSTVYTGCFSSPSQNPVLTVDRHPLHLGLISLASRLHTLPIWKSQKALQDPSAPPFTGWPMFLAE